MYCIIKIRSRSLTFYNLTYNEALLTPSTHQKNFMQNVGGRKKYLASTYPKKKNSWGIKGLKKHSCLYQITQPPPSSEVQWLAPYCDLIAALAKHQFTVKFTELSVDLLSIILGERYLFVCCSFCFVKRGNNHYSVHIINTS